MSNMISEPVSSHSPSRPMLFAMVMLSITILLTAPGCALFQGGDCDCPTFGQEIQEQHQDMATVEAASGGLSQAVACRALR